MFTEIDLSLMNDLLDGYLQEIRVTRTKRVPARIRLKRKRYYRKRKARIKRMARARRRKPRNKRLAKRRRLIRKRMHIKPGSRRRLHLSIGRIAQLMEGKAVVNKKDVLVQAFYNAKSIAEQMIALKKEPAVEVKDLDESFNEFDFGSLPAFVDKHSIHLDEDFSSIIGHKIEEEDKDYAFSEIITDSEHMIHQLEQENPPLEEAAQVLVMMTESIDRAVSALREQDEDGYPADESAYGVSTVYFKPDVADSVMLDLADEIERKTGIETAEVGNKNPTLNIYTTDADLMKKIISMIGKDKIDEISPEPSLAEAEVIENEVHHILKCYKQEDGIYLACIDRGTHVDYYLFSEDGDDHYVGEELGDIEPGEEIHFKEVPHPLQHAIMARIDPDMLLPVEKECDDEEKDSEEPKQAAPEAEIEEDAGLPVNKELDTLHRLLMSRGKDLLSVEFKNAQKQAVKDVQDGMSAIQAFKKVEKECPDVFDKSEVVKEDDSEIPASPEVAAPEAEAPIVCKIWIAKEGDEEYGPFEFDEPKDESYVKSYMESLGLSECMVMPLSLKEQEVATIQLKQGVKMNAPEIKKLSNKVGAKIVGHPSEPKIISVTPGSDKVVDRAVAFIGSDNISKIGGIDQLQSEVKESIGDKPSHYAFPVVVGKDISEEAIEKHGLMDYFNVLSDEEKEDRDYAPDHKVLILKPKAQRELARTYKVFTDASYAKKRIKDAVSSSEKKAKSILSAKYPNEPFKIESVFSNQDQYVGEHGGSISFRLSLGDHEVDFEPASLYYNGADEAMNDQMGSYWWLYMLANQDSPYYSADFEEMYEYDQISSALEQFSHTLGETDFEEELSKEAFKLVEKKKEEEGK